MVYCTYDWNLVHDSTWGLKFEYILHDTKTRGKLGEKLGEKEKKKKKLRENDKEKWRLGEKGKRKEYGN